MKQLHFPTPSRHSSISISFQVFFLWHKTRRVLLSYASTTSSTEIDTSRKTMVNSNNIFFSPIHRSICDAIYALGISSVELITICCGKKVSAAFFVSSPHRCLFLVSLFFCLTFNVVCSHRA